MQEPFAEDEARFDALALELFAFQFAHCPPYARFCEGRGRTPATVRGWREIPAVPTGAFKEVALRSFPPERTCKVFRTSGTSTERRGALYLDTVTLYEASLLPTFERFVLPDLDPDARARFAVLAPSPGEAPDSSLSHMFGAVVARRGAEGSRFFVRGGAARRGRPPARARGGGRRRRAARPLRHRVRLRAPPRSPRGRGARRSRSPRRHAPWRRAASRAARASGRARSSTPRSRSASACRRSAS